MSGASRMKTFSHYAGRRNRCKVGLFRFQNGDFAPAYSPIGANLKRLRLSKMASAVFLICIAAAIPSPAQTFAKLLDFAGSNGASPYSSLIQGTDGNFYGTTTVGGPSTNCIFGCGTVFVITPAGVLTTLHSFDGTDGSFPTASLVQATDGNFYSTASSGGSSTNCPGGCGTVFMITPAGALTTLHTFVGTDGRGPGGALVQASDGDLYSITSYGGANSCATSPGCGTVFKINLSGVLTTLHNFNGTDGSVPMDGLLQAKNGKFYGTTAFGGANNNCGTFIGCGTVFRISGGVLTTVYNFCARPGCKDGTSPDTRLVQGKDGKFYGTTFLGGLSDLGTIFALTDAGSLQTLHRFTGYVASYPSELIQGADGNLYEVAKSGGFFGCPGGCGAIFKITTKGVITALHRFHGDDGEYPYGGLLQATDGKFYGTTAYGGKNGDGTFFSFTSAKLTTAPSK